jgi:serine/threonine-protein kinase PknK
VGEPREPVQELDSFQTLDDDGSMSPAEPRPSTPPLDAPAFAELGLPPEYGFEAWLRSGDQGLVLRASLRGESVVVRVDPARGADPERQTELAVLARLTHPGLARLIDHGTLPGERGTFVTRSWIEGEDLLALSEARRRADRTKSGEVDSERTDIGRIVVRLCAALEHLHRQGFVHADLKASNVIIAADDVPVITDFGLSRRAGPDTQSGRVAGTLFALSPEQLFGGRVDARSDLFALGVLMHQILVGTRATAQEFYAVFPGRSYFEATRTTVGDLPGWARDVVESLLEREPAHRPRSAAEVALRLSGRLGMPPDTSDSPDAVPLAWPLTWGREEAFERMLQAILDSRVDVARSGDDAPRSQRATEKRRAHAWTLPANEDLDAWLEHARLKLALQGCRVMRLDLDSELSAMHSAADMNRWARALVAASPDVVFFAAVGEHDFWKLRALECLARLLTPSAADRGPANTCALVVLADRAPFESDNAWCLTEISALDESHVLGFLRAHLEGGEDPRVTALASHVWRESVRRSVHVAQLVRELGRMGWIVSGASKPRLRPGPVTALFTREETARADGVRARADASLSRAASRALAALVVCDASLALDDLAKLADVSPLELPGILAELATSDCVRTWQDETGLHVASSERGSPLANISLDETAWRALHARAAERLEAQGASPARVLPHRFRSDPASSALEQALSEAARLREGGAPELALDLTERMVSEARGAGLEIDARLWGEEALCWVALGQPARALAVLAHFESATDPRLVALTERVHGHLATLRHQHEEALAHFNRAVELDPSERADAWLAAARLYYETRQDSDLLELVARIQREEAEHLPERVLAKLAVMVAMSLFRSGQVAEARERLERALEDARLHDDAAREAAIHINLATIARRTGAAADAIDHSREAERLYDREGLLPGLAQSRALLGGVLRETGALEQAEAPLVSAVEIRERLGDRAGATTVRGMLGLLLADRGHVKAALEELAQSASESRAAGRSTDALLFEARAEELRARIGKTQASSPSGSRSNETNRMREADPRILLSLARASAMRGEIGQALEHARRAADLSQRLKLATSIAESHFVLACLNGKLPKQAEGAIDAEATGASGPGELASARRLLTDDARALHLLAEDFSAPGTCERARDFALNFSGAGRNDRAARLYLAIAARSADRELAASCLQAGADELRRCRAGLKPEEFDALTRALLGMPDPWPRDVERARNMLEQPTEVEEESDMDIVRLLEINHRLVQQQDLPHLLGEIVECAIAMTGAERGFLVLEENGELAFETALDSRRGGILDPELEVSKSVLHRALDEGEPLRLSNASEDPLLREAASVSSLELRSILCVPFVVQDGLRGVLYLDHRLRQGAFAERAERMLKLLSDQAALAIQQVRRLEEIRRLNRALKRDVAHKESDLRAVRARLRAANVPVPASGLIGSSPPMVIVHQLIERAAPSHLPVLIRGESGTGKELVARALHFSSTRSDRPFIAENCAAFPASLIEAELFGHRRGAFTGADQDRAGIFERASGGTLFLDEIGELPIDLQAKLLRVLETGEVRRLGDGTVKHAEFRLVTATNRDLESAVEGGTFRADLYYRLDGLRITLPPLSERVSDIPDLVTHFLLQEEARSGRARQISPAVMARLCARDWPGNVRELANEVARLCVLSPDDIVDPDLVRASRAATASAATAAMTPASAPSSARTLAELEREAIERALVETNGDKGRAASLLGISRAKIYQRMQQWRDEGAASDSEKP